MVLMKIISFFSEEVDLCYKIKNAGFKNIYWKKGSIVHEKSLITGKDMSERIKLSYESRLKFFKKHYSKFRLFFLRYTIIGTFLLNILLYSERGEQNKNIKRHTNQLSNITLIIKIIFNVLLGVIS